jgi:hypothetical protein
MLRAVAGPRDCVREKFAEGDYGDMVAAALVGESGPRDLDGVRWKLVAFDGRSFAEVEADLGGSEGGERGMVIEPEAVEFAVERYAAGLEADGRLQRLVERSPVRLDRYSMRLDAGF